MAADSTVLKNVLTRTATEAKDEVKRLGGVDRIAKSLNSSVENGLDRNQVASNRQKYGENVVPTRPPSTFLELALDAIKDETLIILICAAFLSIIVAILQTFLNKNQKSEDIDACIHQKPPHALANPTSELFEHMSNYIEGLAIFMAVGIVVAVTAWNEYAKEKQFKWLLEKVATDQKCSVVRGGKLIEIECQHLVVGDVCYMNQGCIVPVDGVLVHSINLTMDESALTGESLPVQKSVGNDPRLFSGSSVIEGSGKVLVVAVGPDSFSGKTNALIAGYEEPNMGSSENDGEDEPLLDGENYQGPSSKQTSIIQAKLDSLTRQVSYFGLVFAILAVIGATINMAITIVKTPVYDSSYPGYNASTSVPTGTRLPRNSCGLAYFSAVVKNIILAITLLVAAIPEGLPLASTIALAYSVKNMMTDNILVRHLDACETMGSVTTICCDKTGTLTTNQMTVSKMYTGGKWWTGPSEFVNIAKSLKELICNAVTMNSGYTSYLKPREAGGFEQVGNRTDCALLGFVQNTGNDYATIRKSNPETAIIAAEPFRYETKYMATTVSHPDDPDLARMYIKGAPEVLFKRCNGIIDINGNITEVDHSSAQHLEDILAEMSTNGLRAIAVAFADLNKASNYSSKSTKFTLIAICGIEDPIRPEVPDAIKMCASAGITVRMVTGDYLETAKHIARKCGILDDTNQPLVMNATDFNKRIRDDSGRIRQNLFDIVWPDLRVLARSTPEDKHTLVSGIINANLSSEGLQVVAVTGDGMNDAPALKKADVGVAMGITGTDIAKKASDIVITDDNFYSIVKSVIWGRNVYSNIAKFIQFQLTANLVVVFLAFIACCKNAASPVTAVQMLWANLIMDPLASLALATEQPDQKLLDQKPYPRDMPLISGIMIKNILTQTFWQLGIMLSMLWMPVLLPCSHQCLPERTLVKQGVTAENPWDGMGGSEHYTMIFNTFIMMQIFNLINARKIKGEQDVSKGILKNFWFLGIFFGLFIMQALLVQFGGVVFSVVRLNTIQWALCVCLGASVLIWGQFIGIVSRLIEYIRDSSCIRDRCCKKDKLQV